MLLVTTNNIEGKKVTQYYGVVSGETIIGANVVRDFMASISDFFGGRSGAYEDVLRKAKNSAMAEMAAEAEKKGANAVLAIDLDYETVGGSMLMVTCSGTAVRVE